MSGKRTAQEEMNLYQVLLAVQVDISDEGRVCREEDVLPVLGLLWVAESGENSLPVPLQVGVLAIKQTSLQLQAETTSQSRDYNFSSDKVDFSAFCFIVFSESSSSDLVNICLF